MELIPITIRGFESLKRELQHLKSVERPQNIRSIETARAHGDLSENAEFAAAKERQSFIEGRIGELGYKIGNADVIDPNTLSKERAIFGCVVVLENVLTEESVEYQLVGPDESNIQKGRISILSPLGKALLGKTPGEEIKVETPGGRRCYELVEIL